MLSTASTTSQENIQRRGELTKSIENALVNTSDTLSLDTVISKSSGVSSERVSQVSQQVVNNILSNAQTTSTIAQHSGVSQESVKSILRSFSQQTMQPLNKIIESIAKIANISNEQVRLVLTETRSVIDRAQSLVNITRTTKISDTKATDLLTQIGHVTDTVGFDVSVGSSPQAAAAKSSDDATTGVGSSLFENEKVRDFTQAILKQTLLDESVISSIQSETGLSKKQIESTISILSTAPSIADQKTLEKIKVTVGVEPQKTLVIIQSAVRQVGSSSNILGATGTEGGPQIASDADLVKEQLETAVSPEMQIDQIIPLPEEQSLDEYEEIRNLWVSQYEDGEVPTSEDIHTRLDWIRQDTIVITNILNKFLSKDEKMRQQALDDVGFIIPVFLINNLNGAQLITYLKAKLSAAKQVSKTLIKKQETDDLAAATSLNAEENMITADHTVKEENTKHLEVDEKGETREAK